MDLGGLDERTGGVGDPVNTSMGVIAVGIPGTVLHMSDQGVLPIDHVERTVRREFEVGGTKIQVFGNDQILPEFSTEPRVFINHPVLLCTEETDVVVDQYVALNFIGKVSAGYELHPGSRADLVGLQDAGSFHVGTVACLDHPGQHPGKTRSGSMQKKILSVVIESQTPWVGNAELGIADDGLLLRTVSVETSIGSPLGSECGFDVAV